MASKPIKITLVGDDQASKAFGSAEESASRFEGTLDSLGETSKASFAAIGLGAVGIGGAFAAGLAGALDFGAASSKLNAQLGLSAEESGRYGKVAGDLYADAYGDSIDQVNEAVAQVARNIGEAATGSEKDLSRISAKVLDVATAFDQDLGGTAQAVGQLLRTGLAKNADEALDLITTGLQQIPNAGEDLIDTLIEYSVQFKALGLTGPQALGFIQSAMQNGARNTDLAADALKEFNLRARDITNTGAQEALGKLGFNAKDTAEKFAGGGNSAASAMASVLEKLRAIKDPAEQSALATQLLGTQAEDLQGALLAVDPTKLTQGLDSVAGASERLDKQLNDNAKTRLLEFKRSLEVNLVNFIGGPVLGALDGFVSKLNSSFNLAAVGSRIKSELEQYFGAPIRDFFTGLKLPDVPLFGSVSQELGQSLSKGINNGDWSQVGNSLGNAIGSALGGAAEAAAKISESLGELVGKVDWGSIAFEFGKQAPTLVLGLLTGILNFDIGSLFSFVADHWLEVILGILSVAFAPARLIGKVGEILAKIPLVGTLLEWAFNHFVTFSQGIVGFALDAMGSLGRGLLDGLGAIPGSVGPRLAEVLGYLPTIIAVKALELFDSASRFIAKIPQAITGGLEATGRVAGRFIDNIVQTFTGGFNADTLLSAGRALMDGLIRGVAARVGAFKDTIVNAGREGVNAFKDFFKIKSPSRLMWSLSKNVMEGAEGGILDNADLPANAMNVAASRISGNYSTSFVPNASVVAASAASGGSSSQTPSVTYSPTYGDIVVTGQVTEQLIADIQKMLDERDQEAMRIITMGAKPGTR